MLHLHVFIYSFLKELNPGEVKAIFLTCHFNLNYYFNINFFLY